MNISFFDLRFDLFLIIAKEVNQIRYNVVCFVVRFVVSSCTTFTSYVIICYTFLSSISLPLLGF